MTFITATSPKPRPAETGSRNRAELRAVMAMALPAVVTTSARAVMDVADYVMVARLPTEDAQAAILPAQVVMWSYIVPPTNFPAPAPIKKGDAAARNPLPSVCEARTMTSGCPFTCTMLPI